MKALVFTVLALALIACESADHSAAVSSGAVEDSATRFLRVQNEIGVEFGDSNYVFGIIQDLDFTSGGNIAVLDSRRKTVRLYSPDGEFLGELGGEGEAPGEFLNPAGIACLSDGRIAVTDPFSREVELFNEDLQYSQTYSDFPGRAPFVITGIDSGFAGELGSMNREAGVLTTSLVLYSVDSDSVQTFFEVENTFSPEYIIQRIMKPQAGLCSGNESIYYSSPATDEYSVSVYPVDGSAPYELTFPDYSPFEKSDEDIQRDIEAYESRMQSMAASGMGRRLAGTTYDPPENYYATGSIGVDSAGNVWVQRGWESNPTFDLFPPGATEPSGTVTVDPQLDLSSYSFVITPLGMAAFNPDPLDFPKVLVLSLGD